MKERRVTNVCGEQIEVLTSASGAVPRFVQLVVPSDGATVFTLPTTMPDPTTSVLHVGAVHQVITIDYTIVGDTLTWLNNDFILETTDIVTILYFD